VLAEDDEDQRFLVREALEEHHQFEVVAEAANGAEAVDLVTRLRPDVLLLDVDMPVMTGLEAIRPIREQAPATMVVVLSALPRARMAPLMLAEGAVGYLEKGGSLRELPGQLLALGGLLQVADDVLAERDLELPEDLGGPRLARRFVEQTLRQWRCGDALETVKLLVSEVVANAVVHARSEVRIAVQLRPQVVRVAVRDTDPSPPEQRAAAETDLGGRGLALVDALSSAWGIEPATGGKDVWFEVPRFDAEAGDAA
jgi:CheY-like chemotaxis protein